MLHVNDLRYRIAGRALFEGATAHLPAGHRAALVGRNGSGKTTLLRLIAGELEPESGTLRLRRQARIALVAQEAPSGPATVLDTVLAADHERSALLREAESASEGERIAAVHARLGEIGAHAAPARAARILAGLGFDGTAQARDLDGLSGGWRMRVALAAALFAEPDLLLLDEPSNHLDLEATLWLEDFLRRYPRTLLLVSHDRDLLNRSVDHILHLESGRLTMYAGGYDAFERRRRETLTLQRKLRSKQAEQRRHMEAFIARFRYKASKARQAQSRLKALARMEPIAAVIEQAVPSFVLPTPESLAPPLITLERVAVGYDGVAVLKSLSLRLDPDDRIALLGANGNGKSTFAKLLAGRLPALSGEIGRGRKLEVGYFAQHQLDELNVDWTPYRHMAAAMPDVAEPKVRARLGAFGFAQEAAEVPVGSLSGGEKARLVLALITRAAPQLLVLDEPTNHLDVDAREALVQALNEYPGAVVLISHDSHLIELVAERLWLVADGTVTPYDGDLADYRRVALGRVAESAAGAAEAKPSRGEQRRTAAARRAARAPLRQAARQAEAEMAELTAAIATIEKQLGRSDLYRRSAAAAVDLNKERAALQDALDAAEERWLRAQAAVEAAEEES